MSEVGKGILALDGDFGLPEGTEAYRLGKLSVFVGQEDGRWHMSVAHPERLPEWDEIKYLRRHLLPADVHLCLPWPTEEFWLNLHPNCLHLWELRDPWLIEQMEFEGMGARASRIVRP